jgi:hypothetical protein
VAFQKQTDLILPVGLQLAPPAELAGAGSIALHNFRAESNGALRSRLSATVVQTGLVGTVHTIFRSGSTRYYGASGTLYRGGTSIATGFDGEHLGIVSFLGSTWVMNQSVRGCDRAGTWFSSYVPAAPGAFSPAAAAGGSLVDGQAYSYFITYLTSDGAETDGTEGSVSITPGSGNNSATLTVPTTSDARVNRWNVYRIGNTLQDVLRVNQDPLTYSVGATFTDTGAGDYTDLEVTRLGIALEPVDPPPAARVLIGPYNNRLLAFNSAARPNGMWWTEINQPWNWPGSASDEGNHAPVGDDGDEVVWATIHPGHIRIYKKRSVWRLRGDPETGILEQTNAEIGLIGAAAICSAGGIDYIQGDEGIYACDGDRILKISGSIDPLFRDGPAYSIGAYPLSPLEASEVYRAKNCLAVKNGRLYFGYYESGTLERRVLVCDLATKSWHSETDATGLGLGYTSLYYEGQYSELLGSTLGIIYALEYRSTSESVALKWTSAYRDQGTRDRQKTYADLVIEHSVARGAAADQSLTVKAKLNNGNTADVALGSIPVATTAAGADRAVSTFPVGSPTTRAGNLAVLVEGNCNNEVVLYSSTLHYYLEPRDALTYDSGILDLGDPNAKGFDILWLDIEPTANVTYTLLTDLPGNAVSSRQTHASTITGTARRTFEIPLTSARGRLVQLKLTSTGTFKLYGARLRYRRIALYLDGAQSQTWTSSDRTISLAA